MDLALAAIHEANHRRLPLSFEVCRHRRQVTLACRFPEQLRSVVTSQLFAQYPDGQTLPLGEEEGQLGPSTATWTFHVGLRPDRAPQDRPGDTPTPACRQREREQPLQAGAANIARSLFRAQIRLRVTGPAQEEARARAKLREMAGAFGQFNSSRLASFHARR